MCCFGRFVGGAQTGTEGNEFFKIGQVLYVAGVENLFHSVKIFWLNKGCKLQNRSRRDNPQKWEGEATLFLGRWGLTNIGEEASG